MKATKLLHNLGQSLWLDNITRDLLNTGTLKRYIDELSVTGLTSNPMSFARASPATARARAPASARKLGSKRLSLVDSIRPEAAKSRTICPPKPAQVFVRSTF
jgi:transaldolase